MRRHPGHLRIHLTPLHPLLLALLVLLPSPAMLSAQQIEERPRFWVALGLGDVRDPDYEFNSAVLAQAAYQTGAHHLGLRVVRLEAWYVFEPSLTDVGLIYGRTALTPSGHATVGTGISTVGICPTEPERDSEPCTRGWGIPLMAEAALRWWVVGVGLQAFANVNQERSYVGGALFFQLGRLGS